MSRGEGERPLRDRLIKAGVRIAHHATRSRALAAEAVTFALVGAGCTGVGSNPTASPSHTEKSHTITLDSPDSLIRHGLPSYVGEQIRVKHVKGDFVVSGQPIDVTVNTNHTTGAVKRETVYKGHLYNSSEHSGPSSLVYVTLPIIDTFKYADARGTIVSVKGQVAETQKGNKRERLAFVITNFK